MSKMDGKYPYGYYHIEDLEAMDRCIRSTLPRSSIVEIGCCYGRSTSVLAKCARDYGTAVYCIDPFFGGEEPPFDENLVFDFIDNMLLLELYEHIRILPMRSELAADLPILKRISVLHLDGSHVEEKVCADVRNFSPRVRGLIIFHDTDRLEVQQAQKLLGGEFEQIHLGKMMSVMSNLTK